MRMRHCDVLRRNFRRGAVMLLPITRRVHGAFCSSRYSNRLFLILSLCHTVVGVLAQLRQAIRNTAIEPPNSRYRLVGT